MHSCRAFTQVRRRVRGSREEDSRTRWSDHGSEREEIVWRRQERVRQGIIPRRNDIACGLASHLLWPRQHGRYHVLSSLILSHNRVSCANVDLSIEPPNLLSIEPPNPTRAVRTLSGLPSWAAAVACGVRWAKELGESTTVIGVASATGTPGGSDEAKRESRVRKAMRARRRDDPLRKQ